ncbi:MAG: N-acetylmannosamine kinase, partial [Oscillospiraceae bacterium]|nr:N-acetylmannosamine kinase [Oscillospiraceae bacterium]MDY5735758.1 N-acetylmannosamine kinase [Oscillospiraceae bacterium]
MAKNILHTIEKNMSGFSKGQKLIAHFILENYDKAAFMTASKLGKTVQVSESTVVRFATQLGYDGYPSMQRALQEMIRGKLTSLQRIEASDGALAGSDLLTNVLQRDME